MTEAEVTLAILAGGRGERMGKAKGLLRVGNQPILSYLLKRFAWRGPTMLVTSPGRERPPGAEGFDVEVVDPIEGEGPVRGVRTALEHLRTNLLLLATVDMPLVGREQLLWLMDQLETVPLARGLLMEREKEIESFPLIFRKKPAQLYEDARSMRSLAKTHGFAVVAAPGTWPADVWTNLNEPGDLEAFERRFGG